MYATSTNDDKNAWEVVNNPQVNFETEKIIFTLQKYILFRWWIAWGVFCIIFEVHKFLGFLYDLGRYARKASKKIEFVLDAHWRVKLFLSFTHFCS